MSLRVPNVGKVAILTRLLNGGSYPLTLGLFKNNLIPGDATVLGDLTASTFTGYAAVTLTDGGWTIASGAPAIATYPVQTFVCSAAGTPETAYGYYIYSGATLFWAERFPTSRLVSLAGASIPVNPRITDQDSSD